MSKKDLELIGLIYENLNTFNITDRDLVLTAFTKIFLGKQFPVIFVGNVGEEEYKFGDFIEEITHVNEVISKNQVNQITTAFLNKTLDIKGKQSYVSRLKQYIYDKLMDEYNLSKSDYSKQVELDDLKKQLQDFGAS